ncbi:MAG: hypothetical protein ABGY29_06620 [bacterium]
MTTPEQKSEATALAEAAFIGAQFVWLIGTGGFAWILRDGLGPDAVTTAGESALAQTFWTFYWGPVCLAPVVVDIVWWRSRRRRDS